MAKRVSVVRHDTEAVQGEGSFVVMTSMKVSEVKELRKANKAAEKAEKEGEASEFDDFAQGLAMIAAHILDWDWVDDEGDALDLPKDNPSVVEKLTHQEADFLSDLLTEGVDTKNSDSKLPKPSG